ncbi:helix-turn-helix domain-containing protein [Pseudoglutamicibacter cumminsii]|uniref:Helix-turn-helix domain-containing protein n=1 Tax=Pseudoglutamicibacter cumminsii TaxID=156979 RepID=A0AAP4FDH5_9MICC|nr:helix-turn-helix domain-containing protein [Pseudoglutamicibacter cumminsii]MDK6275096.1 helix-turn-helix domain-containing protein [Pseudoglutamicibacter cumminsii]
MEFASSKTFTTSDVAQDEATDYWVELICETFVKLSAQQLTPKNFQGGITWKKLGHAEFSTVNASGQEVVRTKEFASSAIDEYLLFSIQRRGQGYVSQDGRTAKLSPGDMAIYDSSRPYSLHFPSSFEQLVVQLPKSKLGADDTRSITALLHPKGSAGAVAASLLSSLNEHLSYGNSSILALESHVIELLGEVTTSPSPRVHSPEPSHNEMAQIRALMRKNLANSAWTVDQLASQAHLSRRSLYRLFPNKGPAEVMRSMRIDKAKTTLRNDPSTLIIQLAHECGFDSESGFIRAFTSDVGVTPKQYASKFTPNGGQ